MLFIPGLACGGDVWDGTIAHLGGRVQAHVLTLAGFAGGPPAIAPPFLSTVRDQIAQYIRANHLQRPIVVGHSIGGVLAIWLAETDRDIAGVVDVEGFPYLPALRDPGTTAQAHVANAKKFYDAQAAMTRDQIAAQTRQALSAEITNPDEVDRMMITAGKSEPAAVAAGFAELFTTDLRPDLAKIGVPVLIVAAADHGKVEQVSAMWNQQVSAIPHHDLQVVEDAKHFVMLDQPARFYALLDAFLAR